MTHLDTRTRQRARVDRPDGHRLVDLAFVVTLTCLALSGFASSFTGQDYLVVGVVGTVLGAVIATLFRALRWPVVAAVLALLGVFLLLGGPLCLRSIGDTAYVPGGSTLGELTDQVLFGWKDMLTTLPPVDGSGPLLVLPWTLGLVSGFIGAQLVHLKTRRPWLTALVPVLACALALVLVIALGVRHPQSLWLQGVGFAALALGWLALRGRRESAAVRGGSRGIGRGIAGVALLGAAAVLALPVANAAMGTDTDRTVLRSYVEPPFDIGRYPSLLASFRNYVELPASARDERPTNVFDKELLLGHRRPRRQPPAVRDARPLRRHGVGCLQRCPARRGRGLLPAGLVGHRQPGPGGRGQGHGDPGRGYRGVWLPVIGALQSIDFESGEPSVKADSFRYNLATSTAVVPSGLYPGDRYSFTAVAPDDDVTATDAPSSQTGVPAEGIGFLDGPASQVDRGGDHSHGAGLRGRRTPQDRGPLLRRREEVRAHLLPRTRHPAALRRLRQRRGDGRQRRAVRRDDGADGQQDRGAGPGGHGRRRARGRRRDRQGRLRLGRAALADGSWRTLPTEAFMSDRPPSQQQPQTQEPLSGTVVPPPAPIPPPSDLGEQSDSDLRAKMANKSDPTSRRRTAGGLPAWVAVVVTYVGIPLLVVVLSLGSIIVAKALRRRRRRRAAAVSTRFVGAWRELVDHALDLGQPVPLASTVTRREQSVLDHVRPGRRPGPRGRQIRLGSGGARAREGRVLLGAHRQGTPRDVAHGGAA